MHLDILIFACKTKIKPRLTIFWQKIENPSRAKFRMLPESFGKLHRDPASHTPLRFITFCQVVKTHVLRILTSRKILAQWMAALKQSEIEFSKRRHQARKICHKYNLTSLPWNFKNLYSFNKQKVA